MSAGMDIVPEGAAAGGEDDSNGPATASRR